MTKKRPTPPPAHGLPATHDAFFRFLVADIGRAAILLRECLPPALAAMLADEPPKLIDGNFIDDDMRGSYSDCLFEVALKSGDAAFVYVLIEHKSRPDWRVLPQLAGYVANILKRHAKRGRHTLPSVIPVVFYHGRRKWPVPRSLGEMTRGADDYKAYTLNLRYILRDLGAGPPAPLSADPTLRDGFTLLRHGPEKRIPDDVLRGVVGGITLGRTDLGVYGMNYIIRAFRAEPDTIIAMAESAAPG